MPSMQGPAVLKNLMEATICPAARRRKAPSASASLAPRRLRPAGPRRSIPQTDHANRARGGLVPRARARPDGPAPSPRPLSPHSNEAGKRVDAPVGGHVGDFAHGGAFNVSWGQVGRITSTMRVFRFNLLSAAVQVDVPLLGSPVGHSQAKNSCNSTNRSLRQPQRPRAANTELDARVGRGAASGAWRERVAPWGLAG